MPEMWDAGLFDFLRAITDEARRRGHRIVTCKWTGLDIPVFGEVADKLGFVEGQELSDADMEAATDAMEGMILDGRMGEEC